MALKPIAYVEDADRADFVDAMCDHDYDHQHLKALTAEDEDGPRDEETREEFAERMVQEYVDKKISDHRKNTYVTAMNAARDDFERQYQKDNPPPVGVEPPRAI